MECPYRGEYLLYTDYYGRNLHLDILDRPKEGFIKSGDIYKYNNEDCEMHQESFYTDPEGELHDGYPC